MCIALLFSETSGSADTDWCRLHENQTCAKCWLVSIMLCYLNLFTGCPNLPAKEPKKLNYWCMMFFFNLDHYLEDLFLRGKFSRILLFCWSSLSLVELLSTIYQRLMDFLLLDNHYATLFWWNFVLSSVSSSKNRYFARKYFIQMITCTFKHSIVLRKQKILVKGLV